MITTELDPVVSSVTVPLPASEAWELFTNGMAEWWPFGSHSIGDERVVAIDFENHVGGRVTERWDDGTEHEWAEVLAWEPPRRIVLAWHPNPDATASTEVEITLAEVGTGTTVVLEHRGWERLGADAARARASYASGWVEVLGELERRARSNAT